MLWDSAGKFFRYGGQFFVSIILARLISPAEFGLIAMVNFFAGFSSIFSTSGLGSALIQNQDVTDRHFSTVYGINFAAGFILTSALFFAAEPIAYFYGEQGLVSVTQAMSLIFIIESFFSIHNTKLRKELRYKKITAGNLIGFSLSSLIAVSMAYLDYGVWALVFQSLTFSLFSGLYRYFASGVKLKFKFDLPAFKEMWRFSSNIFYQRIYSYFFQNLDSLLIGKFFNAALLGYYKRGRSVETMFRNIATGSLGTVLFPALSLINTENERFERAIDKVLNLISFSIFLFAGLSYLESKQIIVLLYSEKWLNSVVFFEIIALSLYAYPLTSIFISILNSKGNSKYFLYTGIFRNTLKILSLVFGLMISIEAYLYATIVTSIIGTVFTIYYTARVMKVNVSWFYARINQYVIIAVFLGAVFKYLDYLLHIENNVLHLITYGGGFVILYVLINYFNKSAAIFMIKDELQGISIIKQIKSFIKK